MKRKSGFHGVGVSCRCCDKQKTSLYTYFPLLAKFILADCRVSTSLTAAAVDMNVEQCNSALGCFGVSGSGTSKNERVGVRE